MGPRLDAYGNATAVAAVCRLVSLAVLILFLSLDISAAQAPPTGARKPDSQKTQLKIPEHLTEKQVDALLARLSDGEVRKLLQEYLVTRARRQTAGTTPTVFTTLNEQLKAARIRVPRMVGLLPQLPAQAGRGLARLREGRSSISPWAFALWLLAAWGLGLAAWYAVTNPLKSRLTGPARAKHVWTRAGFEVAGIVSFGLVSGGVLAAAVGGNSLAGRLYVPLFWAGVLSLVAIGLSRLWLGTGADLRERFGDAAIRVHHRFSASGIAAAFAGAIPAFLARLGVSEPAASALLFVGGWLVGVLLISALLGLQRLFWSGAAHEAATHETPSESQPDGEAQSPGMDARTARKFGEFWRRNWASFFAAYVLLVLVIWSLRLLSGSSLVAGGVAYSLLLLVGVIVIDRVVVRLLSARRKSTDDRTGLRELPPASAALVFGVRLALIVGGALIFLSIWGMNLVANVNDAIGPALTRAMIDIALVLYVAYVIYITLRAWIDRRLAEEAEPEAEAEAGEGGGAPRSRIATLLPLARGIIGITVFTMAVLIVLSRLGVDIGPLLAGAGVVGLAIGFGSQTLVRDIVSGAFFLVDDAFRLGEYVESGSVKGTVEQIGIRSIRLRHHRGMVHTIPYGELKSVTNYSRDWVIMKLEFRLPFGTDMERVRKLIKRTGQQMAEIPEFADKMLEPLKSQGVIRTEGAGLVFRAKFMTKPGDQFLIRREAFRRIQEALMADGIEFAPEAVTVKVMDEGTDSREAAIEAAGAAAAGRGAARKADGT